MTNLIYPRYPVTIGLIVAVFLLLFGIGAIASLIVTPTSIQPNASADQSMLAVLIGAIDQDRLFYSLKSAGVQASLSVFFSILIAIPAAITVSRRPTWLLGYGMRGLVMLVSLAMVLPSTVAAMGLLAVWGRNGAVASLCGPLCGDFSIYGLHGVVLAHMMLNVPLVMRVMIPLLNAVHQSKWRNAALLGFSSWGRFRHIEWPQIRGVIPGLASLIFMLCFTSFALVLMLGGGPKVTTLEVEIYGAVRFDFNLLAAAGLSLIQFGIMALVVAVFAFWGGWHASGDIRTPSNSLPRPDLTATDRIWDIAMLSVVIMLVAMPVVMVAIRGMNTEILTLLTRSQFFAAAKASFSVAMITAVVVTILSLVMAYAKASLSLSHRHRNMPYASQLRVLLDQGVLLYLVIPSVVLGTAAFIVLRGLGDVFGYAFAVVVMANTLLTLPFAYRLLERRLTGILAQHDRLAVQLGIMGMSRLKILTLPALRHDLGLVAGLTAALSIGDLGVIALFANADFRTLPWLLYQLSGKYAADEAAALAFVLMIVTVAFFWLGRVLLSRLLGGDMLEIKNLRFSYPSSEGEFAFDLTVDRGEIAVVQGRSGIGKSTLLNLIAGFLTPSAGQILWQGDDLTALPPQKRPLSMIFQDGNLFDHLSCRHNVALGLNPSLSLTSEQWQAVDNALDALGILSLKHRKPTEISGGQQQRVALARALIRAEWQDCHLLLFDEPFSALDTETRLDCIEVVKTLVQNKSMAALMVSHDPEDAKRLAAKVFTI